MSKNQFMLDVECVFGGYEVINYTSKKSGKHVEGLRVTLLVDGMGVIEFAFGECRVDEPTIKQWSAGERCSAVLELVKGYQDKPVLALVDLRPLS